MRMTTIDFPDELIIGFDSPLMSLLGDYNNEEHTE